MVLVCTFDRGGFRIFRRGGGHTLIERAISYHFIQKGYHVRACTTGTRGYPRRAVPATVWLGSYFFFFLGGGGGGGGGGQFSRELASLYEYSLWAQFLL